MNYLLFCAAIISTKQPDPQSQAIQPPAQKA
jgi:hypothetical protein